MIPWIRIIAATIVYQVSALVDGQLARIRIPEHVSDLTVTIGEIAGNPVF
jgi:hypothetical protein